MDALGELLAFLIGLFVIGFGGLFIILFIVTVVMEGIVPLFG